MNSSKGPTVRDLTAPDYRLLVNLGDEHRLNLSSEALVVDGYDFTATFTSNRGTTTDLDVVPGDGPHSVTVTIAAAETGVLKVRRRPSGGVGGQLTILTVEIRAEA